jgi:hypothetical protein
MTGGYGCGNLLFTVRLACHDTDANQFREEGRHFHLDRHDRLRLYDRRYDLRALVMRRLIEPWTPLDDQSIKAFAAQGASVMRVSLTLSSRSHERASAQAEARSVMQCGRSALHLGFDSIVVPAASIVERKVNP